MDGFSVKSVESPATPATKVEAAVPESLEQVAARIFGADDTSARRRWVQYWTRSAERNRRLLESFEAVILLDHQDVRVLDIGCGTGGLAGVLAGRGARYLGGDLHRHVLQFAPPAAGAGFVQLSGLDLPVASGSQDLVLAFDVIEHLVGGKVWQARLLAEVRRVLAPSGVCLLTTPNFWFPWDAHTELYGPQFLPVAWADRYIASRNPGFLAEHGSFRQIRLLRPGVLRRLVREAGLAPLHDLPCALDTEEYRSLHPVLGGLTRLGLGWLPHAEFWMVLGRREEVSKLRARLRKRWNYVHAQPDAPQPERFQAAIDFDAHPGGHQLLEGWHWHERDRRGYRWIETRARCLLQTRARVRRVDIEGFCPEDNRLEVRVEGMRVGECVVPANQVIQADFLLPWLRTEQRLLEVELRCGRTRGTPEDRRELGMMIFTVGVSP